jgi:hypothetical protein
LSIARDQHYDIVTRDGEYHEALLATKEDAIFETLLHEYTNGRTTTIAQTRQELGQLVITMSGVNFNALLPERIPELQASPHSTRFNDSSVEARAPSTRTRTIPSISVSYGKKPTRSSLHGRRRSRT